MRFGLLHKSNNSLIAGNTFHRFDVSAIAMQNTWQETGEISQQVLILDNTFEYNGGWPVTTALTSPYQENRRRNCYSIVGASVNLARGQWNLDEYSKAILEGIHIEDNRL